MSRMEGVLGAKMAEQELTRTGDGDGDTGTRRSSGGGTGSGMIESNTTGNTAGAGAGTGADAAAAANISTLSLSKLQHDLQCHRRLSHTLRGASRSMIHTRLDAYYLMSLSHVA